MLVFVVSNSVMGMQCIKSMKHGLRIFLHVKIINYVPSKEEFKILVQILKPSYIHIQIPSKYHNIRGQSTLQILLYKWSMLPKGQRSMLVTETLTQSILYTD